MRIKIYYIFLMLAPGECMAGTYVEAMSNLVLSIEVGSKARYFSKVSKIRYGQDTNEYYGVPRDEAAEFGINKDTKFIFNTCLSFSDTRRVQSAFPSQVYRLTLNWGLLVLKKLKE